MPGFLPGPGLKGTDRIPHSLTNLIFQQTHTEPDPALGIQRRAEFLPSWGEWDYGVRDPILSSQKQMNKHHDPVI